MCSDRVRALVQGTRPRPYRVSMGLKPFTRKDIAAIESVIASDPSLAAQLSLGRLPPDMLALLEKLNIGLWPEKWSDIDAECSCPDWANPCKHLAAVYYLLAEEIDKNPFLPLHLRGLGEERVMRAAGLASQPRVSSRLAFTPPGKPHCAPLSSDDMQAALLAALEGVSGRLGDRALFSLLAKRPPFYDGGDFKELLLEAYRRTSDWVDRMEVSERHGEISPGTSFWLLYPPGDRRPSLEEVEVFADPALSLPLARGTADRRHLPGTGGSCSLRWGSTIPLWSLLEALLGSPLKLEEGISSSLAFVSAAAAVSQALAQSWAFVPEVCPWEDGGFRVRYVPLERAEGVSQALEKLARAVPPGLIFRPEDGALLTGPEAAEEILSLFLTHLVHRSSRVRSRREEAVPAAFFDGRQYRVRSFRDRHTARSVQDWLSRLGAEPAALAPVLSLEPAEDTGFFLSVEVESRPDPAGPLRPLGEVFGAEGTVMGLPADEARTQLARQITLLGEHIPEIREILESQGSQAVRLEASRVVSFLREGRSLCRLLGVRVMIPRALREVVSPRAVLRASAKGSQATVSYLHLEEVLSYSWEVALGDETITREEFLDLVSSAGSLVWFRGRYLLLDPDEVRRLVEKMGQSPPQLSSMESLRVSLSGEWEGVQVRPDRALEKILARLSERSPAALPGGFRGALRPYQEEGFGWLYANANRGLGSCLADDMGLGKTVQATALLLRLREDDPSAPPSLVVCPTGLISNWERELERFAPDLRVSVYHGAGRRLTARGADVIITSYGIVRAEKGRFRRRGWQAVVADEAQNLKNPGSAQTRAIKSLKSVVRVALTGTPVENRLLDLWSLMDFLNPGYLGSQKAFTRRFSLPVEKYRDERAVGLLRRAVAPLVLRRQKIDRSIMTDLPDKVVRAEYCRHTPTQAGLYQRVVEETWQSIERSQGIERKGRVLQLITALKQICNHPAHYTGRGSLSRNLSGKADRALGLLEEFDSQGEKALVFTQYRKMGDILLHLIREELGQEPLFFHGSLSRKARQSLVDAFQNDSHPSVMIVSLRAGGTGLNLTAATRVIHYDLWWNPAVETQAEDRTYRLGQDRNVMVHRLITSGTLEEKIDRIMADKKELAQLAVADGGAWLSRLSDRDLRELVRLGREA